MPDIVDKIDLHTVSADADWFVLRMLSLRKDLMSVIPFYSFLTIFSSLNQQNGAQIKNRARE
jgi:hypothetical protein